MKTLVSNQYTLFDSSCFIQGFHLKNLSPSCVNHQGPALKLKQLTNTLKIRILSETSILYLICYASIILIGGSPPVKTYANKPTLLEEK